MEGFFCKPLSLFGLFGGESSSSISSFSKDDGFSLGRTKSLVPWREQGVGLLSEGKGDVYRPLRVISGKGLVVESPKIQLKDTKKVNPEVCNDEGELDFGSPNRRLSAIGSFSNPSF